MKSENMPSKDSIAEGETIKLHTRFGDLSRGKAWGKCFVGKKRAAGDFQWVDKTGGTLYLTQPGYYIVGSSDGFNRSARGEFYLAPAEVPQTDPLVAAVRCEGPISNERLAEMGL